MGYYTSYDLEIKGVKTKSEFDSLVEKMKEKDLIGYVFCDPEWYEGNEIQYLETYDTQKWYDHEVDMAEISRCFPDMTFELSGNGEEYDDLWRKYFKDGSMESCYAIIPKPVEIPW